jgi:beta-phosphoglucomutase-like phosphatase (HAD superfamily)
MEIKALIFDCDGTLADTMPLHWLAWQTITSRHNVIFPEDRFYALGGVPSRHILQMLREEQRLSIDPIAVSREKEEEYLKLMAQVGPIHEVVEIAKDHTGKLPMAVASGGTRAVIEKVLRHLNIRDLLSFIRSRRPTFFWKRQDGLEFLPRVVVLTKIPTSV